MFSKLLGHLGGKTLSRGPLSRTQPPTAQKGIRILHAFFIVLDDQTIPSRLNRKLPESLTPILGLELLRRRVPLTPERYNHHHFTGLHILCVFVRPYAYFSWVEAPGRRQWPRNLLVKSHPHAGLAHAALRIGVEELFRVFKRMVNETGFSYLVEHIL